MSDEEVIITYLVLILFFLVGCAVGAYIMWEFRSDDYWRWYADGTKLKRRIDRIDVDLQLFKSERKERDGH